MTAFILQTSLLMLAAYLLGAALACLIRRSFHATARHETIERRVDPLPEYAHRNPAPVAAPPPAPVPVAAPVAPPPRPQAPPAPAAAQDFKRIRLIDADMEQRLKDFGVTRYEQIAAWTRADVDRISKALGLGRRIARENWIEQAQVLAKGGETMYAARRARGETATALPTHEEPKAAPVPAVTAPPVELPRPMSSRGVAAVVAPPPETTPLVSERAAFAASPEAALQHPAAIPRRPAPPADADNLLRIGGITKDIAAKLNEYGISRYAQIAQLSAAEVAEVEGRLDMRGRIARENWIEQAQILSRGGDTRFSREFDSRQPGFLPTKLVDAIREKRSAEPDVPASPSPSRQDLGNLRSVRSEAYRDMPEPGPEAARTAASRRIAPSGPDDLKRIRGIGVLIEKRLNTLGVTGYEHIANWTATDIDRISQSLDFKGRIERENWVEQARILSSGGHTEFSRRVDRGEVETSKPKP
jgi:predicted flap endonuclease-1-like 5' DNA nuclease